MEEQKYDTIIVGAGAAGCSAAIYATRYNLKTLLLSGFMPGGLISKALEVENYPGYLSVSGKELAKKFVDQAVRLGADYKTETVENVIKSGQRFVVKTSNAEYKAKSIILATGTQHRKLGVVGETKFAGRGVSYCATCDGPFFKQKTVAVIGGGNSAVEGAQDLSMHANKVYIVYRANLSAAPIYIENLRKNPKIVEIRGFNITEIQGESVVTKVVLDKEYNGSLELAVDGVFIQIGYEPKNDLAKLLGIELSKNGYIKVDAGLGTSIKGVFSAGDLNNYSNQLHQQVTSASEGAIAAQSAYRFTQGVDYILNED